MGPKNSLEALENLVYCKSETKCKECKHKNICTLERDYNIIKSDIETLNNENKVLKFENKVLTEGLQNLGQDKLELTEEELQFIYDRCFSKATRLEEINLKDTPCYRMALNIMHKINKVKKEGN